MNFDTIMPIVAVVLLGGIFLYRWRVTRKANQLIGQPVPDTGSVDGGIDDSRRVYYFYSESCRVCRGLKPMVDAVAAEYPNMIRVDVPEHIDLATRFDIMGTPTFVAVADGRIVDVKLGSASKVWLRSYLEA